MEAIRTFVQKAYKWTTSFQCCQRRPRNRARANARPKHISIPKAKAKTLDTSRVVRRQPRRDTSAVHNTGLALVDLRQLHHIDARQIDHIVLGPQSVFLRAAPSAPPAESDEPESEPWEPGEEPWAGDRIPGLNSSDDSNEGTSRDSNEADWDPRSYPAYDTSEEFYGVRDAGNIQWYS